MSCSGWSVARKPGECPILWPGLHAQVLIPQGCGHATSLRKWKEAWVQMQSPPALCDPGGSGGKHALLAATSGSGHWHTAGRGQALGEGNDSNPGLPLQKLPAHGSVCHRSGRAESCADREWGPLVPLGSGVAAGAAGLWPAGGCKARGKETRCSPTGLMGAPLPGRALRPVSRSVEGRDADQVLGVAGQVLQLHHRLRQEQDLHLLCFVLAACLPVVNLWERARGWRQATGTVSVSERVGQEATQCRVWQDCGPEHEAPGSATLCLGRRRAGGRRV